MLAYTEQDEALSKAKYRQLMANEQVCELCDGYVCENGAGFLKHLKVK